MIKLIQAFLSGIFFTFILDFFLFLSVKINYIQLHNIDVYYNILFTQHQNIFVFLFFTIIIGYLINYTSTKTALIGVGSLFILVSLTFIPPLGEKLGETLFMKKDVTLKTDKFSYHGNIYYDGRNTITFYDYKLKKVIILDKNKVIGEY